MNGVTGAAAQNTATGPVPYTPAEAADLKATGFGFSPKGMEWDQWIDTARTSKNPEMQAQYRELVDLAGGRTDNAAIKVAMERYGAMQQAASPGATAADKQAALRGLETQLLANINPMGQLDRLGALVEVSAREMLADSSLAGTPMGQALDRALATAGQVQAFRQGVNEGIYEGAKSLVTGVVGLAGKAIQLQADMSIAGAAGDQLRGLTGKLPGWLDSVVPSNARGIQSTVAMVQMGRGIGNYLANHSPAEVANDIKNALGKAWDGLAKDYEAAKAQGPEAEARWLGKVIGRVAFEIGATFIPVAGQAGKVSSGVRLTDAAVDGARGLDKVADGTRLANKVEDGVRGPGKADEIVRASEEGFESLLDRARRILGDLPLNSKSLDDLYQASKMTMSEARALAKSVDWKDAGGSWIYPPNNGFHGIPTATPLKPTAKIDRYGGYFTDGNFVDNGNFVSKAGATFESRALPVDSLQKPLKTYEVLQQFDTMAGPATPWFDQVGGGIQYMTERKIGWLVERGYIREIK